MKMDQEAHILARREINLIRLYYDRNWGGR